MNGMVSLSIKVHLMLAALQKVQYQNGHEQAAPLQARPNPRDALRGFVHALDKPRCGRVDQHGIQAAG